MSPESLETGAMRKFIAVTSSGLSKVLADEVQSLGFKNIEVSSASVSFVGNWRDCYLAHLRLRSATRILMPMRDFFAYQLDDIYHQVGRIDFTKYILPSDSLMVEASVEQSLIHDQRMVALKTKDAIVDQFRSRYGIRPNVDKDDPVLKVVIRIYKNQARLCLDLTGTTLFKRGYRASGGVAPLREHIGAGILKLIEWTPETALVDPMCGSGTLLIEAALLACGKSALPSRTDFIFQKLKSFQASTWQELIAQESGRSGPQPDLYGFDQSASAISIAKKNAAQADVEYSIQFQQSAIENLYPPCPSGVLVTNPPYGHRLENVEVLKETYKAFSHVLKNRFQGWTCWMLSGQPELSRAFHLKATKKHFLMNGPIECRLLRYDIH